VPSAPQQRPPQRPQRPQQQQRPRQPPPQQAQRPHDSANNGGLLDFTRQGAKR
jgi:hypothetical protein